MSVPKNALKNYSRFYRDPHSKNFTRGNGSISFVKTSDLFFESVFKIKAVGDRHSNGG